MSHFLAAIGQVDGGAAVRLADEQLGDVLEAVRRTGKKGSVTVELHVSPNGERGFEVTTKVKAKAPDMEFGKSFFYVDHDGRLTRTPPQEEGDNLLNLADKREGA